MASTFASQAVDRLQKGLLPEGVRFFEAGLKENPADLECLLGLARVRLLQGDPKEADRLLQQLLSFQPAHNEGQSHRALIRFRAGDQGALEVLRATAMAPHTGSIEQVNYGHALSDTGDSAEAEIAFKRAIVLEPTNVFLRMEAGEAALRRKDGPAAVTHFKAAVDQAPGEYVLLAYLAKAYELVSDLPRAAAALSAAINLAPLEPALHEEMYFIHCAQKAWGHAAESAERLTRIAPNEVQYRYWRGVSLLKAGQLEPAQVLLEDVASRVPNPANVKHALAELQLMRGDRGQAQRLLEDALSLAPTSPAIANDLASLYTQQSEGADRAEQVLLGVLAAIPDDLLTHYNLGLVLAPKDPKRALEHACRAAAAADNALKEQAERLIQSLRHTEQVD
jgi:tetratricopeptide (TPR) repeat protein